MTKKLLFIFCLVVLSGCTAKPIYLYSQTDTEARETTIISSQCGDICKNKIESTYKIDTSFGHTKNIGPATIQRINGRLGFHTNYCGDCAGPASRNVYNNGFAIDGGYEVHALAGNIEIDLYVNYWQASTPRHRKVQFISEPGHTYFVGQLTDSDDGVSGYKWTPLVFDLTDEMIVYPHDDLKWFKF